MIRLERALVFFDLETTGIDPRLDRVVQIACIRLSPEGTRETFDSLVNPAMRIPRESSAIHGITDEMVRDAPRFPALAPKIKEFFRSADLGGFGITRFDVPVLAAEFSRAGMDLEISGRRILDALTIFHRLEPRNLAAAHEFYCGKPMGKAHDARADVEASASVFFAQLERYRGRSAPAANLPQDIQGLHEFCNMVDPNKVDARGKFIWRHGQAAFNFGKHSGKSLAEVVSADPSYVEWLSGAESSTPEVAKICREALAGRFPGKAG